MVTRGESVPRSLRACTAVVAHPAASPLDFAHRIRHEHQGMRATTSQIGRQLPNQLSRSSDGSLTHPRDRSVEPRWGRRSRRRIRDRGKPTDLRAIDSPPVTIGPSLRSQDHRAVRTRDPICSDGTTAPTTPVTRRSAWSPGSHVLGRPGLTSYSHTTSSASCRPHPRQLGWRRPVVRRPLAVPHLPHQLRAHVRHPLRVGPVSVA